MKISQNTITNNLQQRREEKHDGKFYWSAQSIGRDESSDAKYLLAPKRPVGYGEMENSLMTSRIFSRMQSSKMKKISLAQHFWRCIIAKTRQKDVSNEI